MRRGETQFEPPHRRRAWGQFERPSSSRRDRLVEGTNRARRESRWRFELPTDRAEPIPRGIERGPREGLDGGGGRVGAVVDLVVALPGAPLFPGHLAMFGVGDREPEVVAPAGRRVAGMGLEEGRGEIEIPLHEIEGPEREGWLGGAVEIDPQHPILLTPGGEPEADERARAWLVEHHLLGAAVDRIGSEEVGVVVVGEPSRLVGGDLRPVVTACLTTGIRGGGPAGDRIDVDQVAQERRQRDRCSGRGGLRRGQRRGPEDHQSNHERHGQLRARETGDPSAQRSGSSLLAIVRASRVAIARQRRQGVGIDSPWIWQPFQS